MEVVCYRHCIACPLLAAPTDAPTSDVTDLPSLMVLLATLATGEPYSPINTEEKTVNFDVENRRVRDLKDEQSNSLRYVTIMRLECHCCQYPVRQSKFTNQGV
jgi:hypothetical protein